jgi:hypothetical protein
MDEESGGVAGLGRTLRDQLRGELVLEGRGVHRTL